MNDRLYLECSRKGFLPRHVCEVGVFMPEASNVLGWIKDNIRAMLIEAHPEYVAHLREFFLDYPQATIISKAVCEKAGTVKLYHRSASSFIGSGESSPAMVNDRYQPSDTDAIEVEAVTFDTLDDGTIDLLSVDIEGGEWFVIRHLLSRPAIISVETHGKRYFNPHLTELLAWFAREGYQVWYRDKSDTVFVKAGTFFISWWERFCASAYWAYLRLRRHR